jgi:hypothetical protein
VLPAWVRLVVPRTRGRQIRTFEGKLLLIIHHAEANGPRKPQIWDVDDSGDKLILKKPYVFWARRDTSFL